MANIIRLKCVIGLCVLVVASILSTGCSKSTKEIAVPNGNFENGVVSPWAPYQAVQAAIVTTSVHGGKYSVSQSGGEGSIYQDVQGLQPGVVYVVSAWVSGSADAAAGALIGVFDPSSNIAAFSPGVPVKQSWQKIEYLFKVTEGTVRIHLLRGPGKGTFFWDDLEIRPEK